MRRLPLTVLLVLALLLPSLAAADSFWVIGSIQESYVGPAAGTLVTFCEYDEPDGFSLTTSITVAMVEE